MEDQNVLVACEESQVVCIAFRENGFNAYSCDIKEPSGGHPEWHILGDATQLLSGGTFTTMDGQEHTVQKWDLVIAHPPCTYLSKAGAVRLYKRFGDKTYLDPDRAKLGVQARLFFEQFLASQCERVAIENPSPMKLYCLPDYTQIIHPYLFGHPYRKGTCLWLKGLPKLEPTDIVEPKCSWVNGGSKYKDGSPRGGQEITFRDGETRSKTFTGIAKAMADQWGKYISQAQN